MARRHDPFDKQSAAASAAFHALLFLVAWLSTLGSRPEMDFITYEIELFSPPPIEQAEEVAPAVEEMTVETPDPTPPEPEIPDPELEQEVTVEQEEQPEDPPEPEVAPVTEVDDTPTPATTTEEPVEEATEAGEDINVRMEGIQRDYPAYYGNIVRQIQNCFRPPQGLDLETTVFFYIELDGSVSEMDFMTRSGNFDFDFSAMGAVECAGGGRFGPLPDDLPYDRLPIQFKFESRRQLQMKVLGSRPAVVTSK
jgi:outer membrane biosynthesis protein TonB